ncbi:MAG: alanyl-tRNA synthetase [Parcubacteria group bacterium Gr01-1014_72]|nr:MAG: alanyl-tRNA synthetase [Parcubacteria group bacterium Gr01-1014_72]
MSRKWTLHEVRQKYLDFFKAKGHTIIPSASLVPENDPTTLFTGSGMQPLVPYLLGKEHQLGTRLANSQKCFRAEDIEEVGDNRHTTFFEMLGNWSLGDYWKQEELPWLFEFLTKEIKISKERLWVTCFEGDPAFGLPRDMESAEIWEKLGIPKERIHFYGGEKNWWSRSGHPENMPVGEPGGPDSEVFYEFTQVPHDPKFGEKCHPNCDCGRFMEIGNSVFMEYRKTENGFEKLPRRNVDFGGGLERITTAANDEPDVFKIDIFAPAIDALEQTSGKSYSNALHQRSFRIIADHTRAAAKLMEDGVAPSNVGQGYMLRRLLRRAILFADKLSARLDERFREEEKRFRKTLADGLRHFKGLSARDISGHDAFLLFSSYGFPLDLTLDLAREGGIAVDIDGFSQEFEKHQEVSRAGAEKKFRGGLADTSEVSVKYHTATHLLHQALRDVLGGEVRQKGSNITPERLRFDFSFPRKLTSEEVARAEKIVNEKIAANLPVHAVTLSLGEAQKSGALHFFDEKYPDKVLVHYIGDTLETAYSKEFCGGPHVQNTGTLGHFKVSKEEAVSAGVRRIKAIFET